MERLRRATWPVGWDHDRGGVFSGREQRELSRYNGATGMSDMAGYAARSSGRSSAAGAAEIQSNSK